MIKVLNITGILPIDAIENRKNENDIIFVTADEIKSRHTDITFSYIYTLPSVNKPLSKLSNKWLSYYVLQKKKHHLIRDKQIFVLGIIQLPKMVFFRNLLYKLSFFLNKRYIDNIIKETLPTVIHAHNVHEDAYLAKRISEKYNIPYIVTLRGLNRCSDKLTVDNVRNAKKIIALSHIQKKAAGKITTQKVALIPHGIEDLFFLNKSEPSDSNHFRLVTVCRLIELKNIDLVIRVLSKIEGDFIFDIYGDGPERKQLEMLILELNMSDKIQIKGFISHDILPGVLKKYNLFIMPSYPETLGRVYFEAMACGLAVIGAKRTGIDGFITEGKEGFLVESNNEDSLYNILCIIFKNPEMLVNMRKSASALSDMFKWDNIVKELYEIYN